MCLNETSTAVHIAELLAPRTDLTIGLTATSCICFSQQPSRDNMYMLDVNSCQTIATIVCRLNQGEAHTKAKPFANETLVDKEAAGMWALSLIHN